MTTREPVADPGAATYPYGVPPGGSASAASIDAASRAEERRLRYAWLYDDEDIWAWPQSLPAATGPARTAMA